MLDVKYDKRKSMKQILQKILLSFAKRFLSFFLKGLSHEISRTLSVFELFTISSSYHLGNFWMDKNYYSPLIVGWSQ